MRTRNAVRLTRALTAALALSLAHGMAVAWSPVNPGSVGAPHAAAPLDELSELLELALKGATPRARAVDDVLDAATPLAAGKFVAELERRLLRAMEPKLRSGAETEEALEESLDQVALLLANVIEYPARTLTALGAARTDEPQVGATQAEAVARFRRIDVAFAILIEDGHSARISVADGLATLRLAAPEGAREARRLLESTLVAALARDELEARRDLARAYPSTAHGLEAAYADALRTNPSVHRLSALIGLLGQRPSGDGVLLNRAHSLALRLGAVLDDPELRVLRGYLTAAQPFERVGAAQTVGALHDRGALQALITLLRDTEPSVRNASHDALRTISAMTIGPSPTRWEAWLAREEAWWYDRGAAELERLDLAEPADALRILREAAQHRLFRAEIAVATQPLLFSENTGLVRMALATLESVRAQGIELDIVELLEHPSSAVRAQAAEALRILTGRVLPGDPMVWRQVLRP